MRGGTAPAAVYAHASRYSAWRAFPLQSGGEWMMTLRRLKLIAIALPVAVVLAMELVRYLVIGPLALDKRLALDAVLVASIVFFSTLVFRVVDRMQARLQRQNEELLALHGAGLDVAAELSLDLVLNKVVEQARNLVGARYGAVSVIDANGRILSFVTSGISAEQRAAIGPPPVGHGLLGVVLHEGQHLRLAHLGRDSRSHGFPANHPKMDSLLAVPISCKGPFRGNLYLTEKSGRPEFTADDHETLERFAVQAAIAIDNAHLHAQVADLAVAEERVRIAREMHDGLAQVLGYVNTKVQAVSGFLRNGNTDEAQLQLRELAVSARQAYSDVRESIAGLRTLPTSERSFAEVLREYVGIWAEQSGVAVSFSYDESLRLGARVELQLMRIVQEALGNVRKHAQASSASVDIRQHDGSMVMTVRDDGSGFDLAARSKSEFPRFGLTTMRERAETVGGRLTVDAGRGRGTVVRLELPLDSATL